ncbi:hypothetical protein KI387_032566 [Taxus chinensis]|uniref:Cytochrome P450 n=2 Tax=Taxus chinensis TaxID=29808 RepID=A0AA38BZW3_TAXCH|nr:hypothetical protein KI387_032566 [Taxus chinensis]
MESVGRLWRSCCCYDGVQAWMFFFMVGIASLMFLVWSKVGEFRGKRTGLPLGTLGWPLIGESLEFISCGYSTRPESFMDKRRLLYGKVFKSHLLGSPTIVSTDPEVSKVVLQNDGRIFVPSYPKSLNELMGKSSILQLNGNLQKRLHGLIGSFLKSPELKEQITVDIEKYVLDSMKNWKDGQLVYIQDETKKIAFQVLLKALMSLNPGEELEYLKQEFRKFISGLVSIPVKFPGTRLYKSLQAKANMVKMVHRIIQDRGTKCDSNKTREKDVLDVLLHETNSITGKFTIDLISDNMIDLMIPGEDSVPMLMTLAVQYLTSCPLALQQLQEENMKLKKSKEEKKELVTWSDYMSLPFTQDVITETLRLGNIITGVMRKALQDFEVKGHLIPKGWCVFTYFRSIHLDEDLYDSPYKFNPWRWQEKDPTGSSFTPFGGGHRLCPGLEIARLEASIFLHLLVTQYSWEAEEDSVVSFPTVHMKNRMPIKVKKITAHS